MKKKTNIPKITTSRNTIITKSLLKKRSVARIYGGSLQQTQIITLERDMRSHKMGEFVPTKKLGSIIHESERNKKRKKKKNK